MRYIEWRAILKSIKEKTEKLGEEITRDIRYRTGRVIRIEDLMHDDWEGAIAVILVAGVVDRRPVTDEEREFYSKVNDAVESWKEGSYGTIDEALESLIGEYDFSIVASGEGAFSSLFAVTDMKSLILQAISENIDKLDPEK